MNENCLAGFCCPECGSEGPFSIQSEASVIVTDDGTDDPSSIEWDAGSHCQCQHCGHSGTVDDFTGKTGEAERQNLIAVVAKAICRACGENPNHSGDARGNDWRWQDYRHPAIVAINAAVRSGGLKSARVAWSVSDSDLED